MYDLCVFWFFAQKSFLTKDYFLIPPINLSIQGLLYTCLVYFHFSSKILSLYLRYFHFSPLSTVTDCLLHHCHFLNLPLLHLFSYSALLSITFLWGIQKLLYPLNNRYLQINRSPLEQPLSLCFVWIPRWVRSLPTVNLS